MSDQEFWVNEETSLKEIGLTFENKSQHIASSGEYVISEAILVNKTNDEDLNLIKSEDCNKIRQWQENRSAEIAKMDSEQFEKEEEMRRNAADELLKWQEDRNELIKTKRQAAKTKIDEPKNIEHHQIWSAALSFCESNVKYSKCTKDTSAYKNALIKMKEKCLST